MMGYFSFKTVCSGNDTHLLFSVKKKETINYSQISMFKEDSFKNYFLDFQCTKTSGNFRISYNITGLTALSEYLKISMEQEKYFTVIKRIQEISSFCDKHHLPQANLVCNPKYMYYDENKKQLLMAFVPLNNCHYFNSGIAQCLLKIHKDAKSIIITDANKFQKYTQYLKELPVKSRKNADSTFFSSDSLLHFFNESGIIWSSDECQNTEKSYQHISVVSESNSKREHYIGQQIEQNAISPLPSGETPQILRTVVVNRKKAYLTDEHDVKKEITECPIFTIGRNPANNLVIPYETVSSYHAEIIFKEGKYIIRDHSSNGTYINQRKIKESELKNGDSICFDEYRYKFFNENENSEKTENSETIAERMRNQNVSRASETAFVSNRHTDVSSKPLAYLKKENDNSNVKIMSYPFTFGDREQIIFSQENNAGRNILFIQNISCPSLKLENQDIPMLREVRTEIFSGCKLTVNNERFTFIVEN